MVYEGISPLDANHSNCNSLTCSHQDDKYMGCLIPKGAGVLNNVYAVHQPQALSGPKTL
jgi:hypothetical protein